MMGPAARGFAGGGLWCARNGIHRLPVLDIGQVNAGATARNFLGLLQESLMATGQPYAVLLGNGALVTGPPLAQVISQLGFAAGALALPPLLEPAALFKP